MRTHTRLLCVTVASGLLIGPFATSGHAASATSALSNPSFAGYQVTKTKGKITAASTSFVVPTITCKKAFSGVGPSVLVQTKVDAKGGVTQSGAGVGVACDNQQPLYTAVVIVNGVEDNDYTVTPGDVIIASVRITAASTSVDIKDTTSGADKTASGTGSVGAIALIGDSAIDFGSASVGIDPFTKTAFSAATVNNKPIGRLGAVAVQRTHGKQVQIAVSRLFKKQNFALTFKNSK
jgi:hypothetical protein